MKLRSLLNNIDVLETNLSMDLEISAVAYDSRKVEKGGLFVAITGFASDGNRFIPMALGKGAVAVVTAKKPEEDVPYILVSGNNEISTTVVVTSQSVPAGQSVDAGTMIKLEFTDTVARD